MLLERIAGKVELSGELGETLDKTLEQANNEAEQRRGMRHAYKDAGEKVKALHDHVSREMAEEKLPLSFDTQAEAASYIKRWINRAVEICNNLGDKAQSDLLIANGKAAALRQAVEVVQRHHNAAVARHNQLTAPPEEDEEEPESESEGKQRRRERRPGQHPGRSSLDERRTEAAKSNGKSSEKTETKTAPAKKKAPAKKAPAKKSESKQRSAKKR